MERENESGCKPTPELSASGVSDGKAAPALYETADGITINFHAPEFNYIDGLNDYAGDYHSFQPLGDIVTADMLHQKERRGIGTAAPDDAAAPLPNRESAGAAPEFEVAEVAPPLTIISRGRTLIVATDAERAIACGKLLDEQGLTCTLLVTNPAVADCPADRDPLALLAADDVAITGVLGAFSATVTLRGEQEPLTSPLAGTAARFDLVLDLQDAPSYAGGRPPLGYYAPGPDPLQLPDVLAELREMRGRFEKPQFTVFAENRCLHGRSRTRDCRQCLDVCPVGAIQSVDRALVFDHHLCQGCGGCALVCPTDAVRMVHPAPGELSERLCSALGNRPAGADCLPTLIISDGESVGQNGSRIAFTVEQIGFVGLDTLLTALAAGAGTVVVTCGAGNSPALRQAVERQIEMAGAILQGLGMPADRIRFTLGLLEYIAQDNAVPGTARPVRGPDPRPDQAPLPAAVFAPEHDKRTLTRRAAQHLFDRSAAQEPSLPLPPGSPFGALAVDAARCTLCMACAAACPSGALSAGGELPRLQFREAPCHQCGLCEETCPEGAIRLLPRLLCDAEAVEAATVLREAEAFRCVECGLPFASPAMITRMEEKLAGHWMYAEDRQLRRLRMCRACRTRDALASQDVNAWNR